MEPNPDYCLGLLPNSPELVWKCRPAIKRFPLCRTSQNILQHSYDAIVFKIPVCIFLNLILIYLFRGNTIVLSLFQCFQLPICDSSLPPFTILNPHLEAPKVSSEDKLEAFAWVDQKPEVGAVPGEGLGLHQRFRHELLKHWHRLLSKIKHPRAQAGL